MSIFDTHVHLQLILKKMNLPYQGDIIKIMNLKDFIGCINVNCAANMFNSGIEIMSTNNNVYGTFGIHPNFATSYSDTIEAEIFKCMEHKKTVAWGECGLDYNRIKIPRFACSPELQHNVFKRQLECAVKCGKPIVVHTREADTDTLMFMESLLPRDWHIHMHCFSDSYQYFQEVSAKFPNAFFGITGQIVSGRVPELETVVAKIPIEKLLLETDGPYMPIDQNKWTTTPNDIYFVAKKIADIKKMDIKEIMLHNIKNASVMYNLNITVPTEQILNEKGKSRT